MSKDSPEPPISKQPTQEHESFILTGAAKAWTAQSDGSPGVFDASAYKGNDGVVLDLNAGPTHPSTVGNERIFIADGTTINKAIGTSKSDALISNVGGGSILEGGDGDDYYEISGKNNLVIAGKGHNSYFLHAGAETVIRGFALHDRITVETPELVPATTAHRMDKNTVLEIRSGNGQDIRITLEGFTGPLEGIMLENHRPHKPVRLAISEKQG